MEGIVFQQCNNLTEFTFPSKLKKIDNKTLLSCGGIKTINISKGITDINSSFTLHCTSLENIFVDEENPNYKDLNGALFDKSGDTLLILPPGSKKYIIDPNTKYIQEFAFSNNPLVISLEIPASVTNIHLNAFDNYNSLRNILVDKDNQHYAEIDGVLFSKDLKTLKRYPRGKSCEYVVQIGRAHV